MVGLILSVLLRMTSGSALALDPLCTKTANLNMNYCPSGSTDWYQSYTDLVYNLDGLSTGSVKAVNFSAVGNSTYSVTTTSGILVTSGGIVAPFFSATGTGFTGPGWGLSGVSTATLQGTVQPSRGGTGQTSLTTNGALFGNGTSGVISLPQGALASGLPSLVYQNGASGPSTGTIIQGSNVTLTYSGGNLTIAAAASSGLADGGTASNGLTFASGSTTTWNRNAIVYACPIPGSGGIFVSSGALNNTGQVTINDADLTFSSYSWTFRAVGTATTTFNNGTLFFNNVTASKQTGYTTNVNCTGANTPDQARRLTAFAVQLITAKAVGVEATAINGNPPWEVTVWGDSISSTTVGGRFAGSGQANSGLCVANDIVEHTGNFRTELAAVPTRIDFCLSQRDPTVAAPSCSPKMNSGYWVLCRGAMQHNP